MNSLKGIVCRAPDTTKKTTLWVAFFVVREAGVELPEGIRLPGPGITKKGHPAGDRAAGVELPSGLGRASPFRRRLPRFARDRFVCRDPDTTKKTTLWVVFFVVREAGVEPARPEWTLEPESSESTNSTTRAFRNLSTAPIY